jgi:hypothetical protein
MDIAQSGSAYSLRSRASVTRIGCYLRLASYKGAVIFVTSHIHAYELLTHETSHLHMSEHNSSKISNENQQKDMREDSKEGYKGIV